MLKSRISELRLLRLKKWWRVPIRWWAPFMIFLRSRREEASLPSNLISIRWESYCLRCWPVMFLTREKMAVSIALKHYQVDAVGSKYDKKIPQALENVVLHATAKIWTIAIKMFWQKWKGILSNITFFKSHQWTEVASCHCRLLEKPKFCRHWTNPSRNK